MQKKWNKLKNNFTANIGTRRFMFERIEFNAKSFMKRIRVEHREIQM